MPNFFQPLGIVQHLSPSLGIGSGIQVAPPTAGHPGIMPPQIQPPALQNPGLPAPPPIRADRGLPAPTGLPEAAPQQGFFDALSGMAEANPALMQQLLGSGQQQMPMLPISVQQYQPPPPTFAPPAVNFNAG